MTDQDREQRPGPDEETQPEVSIGREPADPTSSASSGNGDPLRVDPPDEGWQDWPEGHRHGSRADDDQLRRKG